MSTKEDLKLNKPKIIVVGGPTASGKSSLAVEIAKAFNGCVIGADSMQIYRRMNIGTGKLSAEEMCGIPHKMIDIIEPDQDYSVGAYVKDAKKEIENALLQGKLPIVAGGTGLYINALLNGYNLGGVQCDELYREQLRRLAEESGPQKLYEELVSIDPDSALKISPSDTRRIIRALEIYKVSGRPKSEKADKGESDYDYLFLALKIDRSELYVGIEKRVDSMLQNGLIEEVRALNLPRESQSVKAIGYKETLDFLDGRINLTELGDLIKINTRHYAKRQITYFKNVFPKAVWVAPQEFGLIRDKIRDFLSAGF